jgi:hypothetical protein
VGPGSKEPKAQRQFDSSDERPSYELDYNYNKLQSRGRGGGATYRDVVIDAEETDDLEVVGGGVLE